MQYDPANPLIVQSDRTILLDVHAPRADECRIALAPFAELERSPEHVHTYRLTPLSLWNASSAGFSPEDAMLVLSEFSRFPVPQSILVWIQETAERFGKLRMTVVPEEDRKKTKLPEDSLYLTVDSPYIYREIEAYRQTAKYLVPAPLHPDRTFLLNLVDRGTVKQELLKLGWPVQDEVPLRPGEPLDIELRSECRSGKPFVIREYQKKASEAFIGDRGPGTGFGTIVLPCGAGKTVVGINIMAALKTNTLILTTNISAVHQWIEELKDKTNLTDEEIGEYTGESKTIKPVTVATYQIITWRAEKNGEYPHFRLFRERAWGLIIYDEVHLLPAPVFRVTAELQAVRRAGLTATLVREDGCEGYVFSLVGPKRYDVPWKELEASGWIACARCIEIRVDLDTSCQIPYASAEPRQKHRIAGENPAKTDIVRQLVSLHPEHKILIIGQYLDQLGKLADILDAPIITGKTPSAERDRIYASFRAGEIHVLVVSKVANFAIDLPDASMAVQVSGTFGSRQEEAQRLGRILRPKERTSLFFTLVTRGTIEEEFGANRQKFLAEQGYEYIIIRYAGEESLKEAESCAEGCR